MDVEIVEVGPKRLACVRNVGPYEEAGKAWEKLGAWACPKGLFLPDTEYLGFSHNDPGTVPASELRYDACLTVADDVEGEGDVQIRRFAGGTYGKYLHKGPYEGLKQVYYDLYTKWLPASGREPRPEPPFDKCLNDPHSTPPEELLTEVHIPLK